ncbi:hypothetical protein FACS189443_1810 [Planctomycetales bacterium]|nr:hypothetical protein FACS189443_1810 [Planctomycetales bacterium]
MPVIAGSQSVTLNGMKQVFAGSALVFQKQTAAVETLLPKATGANTPSGWTYPVLGDIYYQMDAGGSAQNVGWWINDNNLGNYVMFGPGSFQHIIFDKSYNLSKIVIKTGNTGTFVNGSIEYTTNGTTWQTLVASVPAMSAGASSTHTLSTVTAASGIRLATTKPMSEGGPQYVADIDIYAMI